MKRLVSLDIFRGITIVLMIIVNSPGNNHPYGMLDHSAWNGCTLADIVFPFFVFIIGVSLVFSLTNSKLPRQQLINKVFKRSLIIFVLGVMLNAIPYHLDFGTLRIYGVLQRIAICYLAAAILYLYTTPRTQVMIIISILLGYFLLITRFPLSMAENLPALVDRKLFSSAHLYGKVFDPEGLLSTLPAIATTLVGNLTGIWLNSQLSLSRKINGLLIAAPLSLLAGWLWGFWFPVNKALWTSSYVLLTGGLALLLLAITLWLVEIRQMRSWAFLFEVFGLNAIATYILHIVLLRIQHSIILTEADGRTANLRIYSTNHLFGWATPQNASLLYSISYVLLLFLLFVTLYRRKIFLKI